MKDYLGQRGADWEAGVGTTRGSQMRLTPHERAVLRLILLGYAPAQAAGLLGVTPPEVQDALERLQARSGVSCRRALLVRAVVQGWVSTGRG